MGRRDSEGKRPDWTIEAGDWEKLYAAFLRAKEKNNLLDVRLSRELTELDTQKVHRDGVMFNDIYEQKQLVFKYKCEVREMKREAMKRERQKSRDAAREFAWKQAVKSAQTPLRTGYPYTADSEAKSNCAVGAATSPQQNMTSQIKTVGNMTSRSNLTEQMAPRNETFITQLTDRSVKFPALNKEASTKADNEQNARKWARLKSQFSLASSVKPRDSVITTEFANEGPDNSSNMKRSSTLPNLSQLPMEEDLADNNKRSKMDITMAEYWVGDPIAIRSVRRPRLNPNEMSDHSQPYGQARKLMVNVPRYPSCSRNCNRPGAELESMVADASMLPKMRMPNLTQELNRLSHSHEHLPTMLDGSTSGQAVLDLIQQQRGQDKTEFPSLEQVEKANEHSGAPDNEATVSDKNADLPEKENSAKLPNISSAKERRRKDVTFSNNSPSSRNTQRSTRSPVKSRSVLRPSTKSSFDTRSTSSRVSAMSVQELVAANKNAAMNPAPIDVLARVQQGDISVKSLTNTNRRVYQIMEEGQRRSVTSRTDEVVVDKTSKFKTHKVKEAIRYSPKKASVHLATELSV